jgi:hypothetical protein
MGSEESKSIPGQKKSFRDVYARASNNENLSPRTSIFKFGTFGELAGSLGILFAQGVISWFLYGVLGVFLYFATTEWVDDQAQLLIYEIVKLICLTISVFLVTRVFEEDGMAVLGIARGHRSFLDFSIGFAISCVVLTFEFLGSLAIGSVSINTSAWQDNSIFTILTNTLLSLMIFCFVGWSEELVSRGFHLRVISRGLNRPLAILLSSAIFSFLHRNNDGITFVKLVFIFVHGLIYALATIRTGQLWLAIGLHAGWDFFVVVFWGSPISDLNLFTLFDIRVYSSFFSFYLTAIQNSVMMGILVFLYTKKKVAKLDW